MKQWVKIFIVTIDIKDILIYSFFFFGICCTPKRPKHNIITY